MKKVSLIIVNYNGRRFLERLLRSIMAQTFRDFEVILVDNASQDDSVSFVRSNFPETKIIPFENRGFGTAANAGARQAQGELLCFFNEDMYLPADFLEKMLAFRGSLEGSEKIGAVSCKMIDFDSDPTDFPETYGATIDLLGFPLKNEKQDDIFSVSGSPFLIARKTFEEVRGFNENIFLYGEDLDFSWRLKIFGYANYISNDIHIYHYGGGVTGGMGPEKIAYSLTCSFIPTITNCSLPLIIMIAPIYIIYILIISLTLLLFKGLKGSYLKAIGLEYARFLHKMGRVWRFRRFVQRNRKRSDWSVWQYVSLIPAPIKNASYKKLSKDYKQGNY